MVCRLGTNRVPSKTRGQHNETDKNTISVIAHCCHCYISRAGCVLITTDEPTKELQAAELSISNAEQARVADYASVELSEAREKLAAAYVAVNDNEMIKAQQLAEEAQADAELAIAKSQAAKAAAVNADKQQNINILKHEMKRNNPGDKP